MRIDYLLMCKNLKPFVLDDYIIGIFEALIFESKMVVIDYH